MNKYDLVAKDYDNVDSTFHNSYDTTTEFKEQIAMFASKVPAGSELLNIGGTVVECDYFSNNGFKVQDIDLSQQMVEYVSKQAKNTKAIKANIKDFSIESGFVSVWACRSLIHIPPKDLKATLKNIHKHLANNGFFGAVFFLSELNHPEEQEVPEEHTSKEGIVYYRVLYPKAILLDIYREVGLTPLYVEEVADKDGDKCIFILAQQEFITKNKPSEWVFGGWLNRIERMEHIMTLRPEDPELASEYQYDVAYMLFPLMEAVSFTLFGKNSRAYLRDMQKRYGDVGFSEANINLLMKVFRNGLTHNTHNNHLEYYDGDIGWGVSSGFGPSHFYFGYKDEEHPEDNEPPQTVFEYVELEDGVLHASLSLDSFIALIREDLKQRKKEYRDSEIPFIVGQRQEGAVPPAIKAR